MNRKKLFYVFILLISFLGINFARPNASCRAEEEFDFEGSIKKAQSQLRQEARQKIDNKSSLGGTAGSGSEAALYEIRRCFDARKKIPKKTWMANRYQFFDVLKALSPKDPDEISSDANGIKRSEIEDMCSKLAYDPDIPAAVQKAALFSYAELSAQYGNTEKIKDLLYEAVKRYPDDQAAVGHVFFNVGKILEQRDAEGCCDVYRTILQLIPDPSVSVQCRHSLAETYLRNAEYDKAIGEFETIISMNTVGYKDGLVHTDYFQWAWLEIGRCNFFLGNHERAMEAFRQALKINPDNRFAQQAKANIEDMEKLKNGDHL